MPSSISQAQLIRDTYARAGLSVEKDRCQYFEAHGTGTKAGDPQEAGAIYRAFFGDKEDKDPNDKLYVGSIKTIVGHTEGTAGIAGLLRASLAMQNGYIPPNMLFEELNPDIEPYYGSLEIVKTAKPWPELPPGVPKRASVNSFGELFLYSQSTDPIAMNYALLIVTSNQDLEEQTHMLLSRLTSPRFPAKI